MIVEFTRSFFNISERRLFGELLLLLKRVSRASTIEWTEANRTMSAEESAIRGKFDTSRTPAFKYVYVVCDNQYIHIVGMMKSSQIGASELENNIIGRKLDIDPCHIVVFFPGVSLLKEYSRKRFQPFFTGTQCLKKKLNIGIAKPSHDYFTFPGGSLGLKTLGSIQSVLSSAIPFIIFEEFAQVKADVAKQGDPLGLGMGRQKSFKIGRKKVLGFSTPTFKDHCNMEKLFNRGFQLIFKGKCHACNNLIELSGWTMESIITYDVFDDRYIDEEYGKYNPDTARFVCPCCDAEWSFEQKTINIKEGLNYGFVDDCGDFSYGWHPRKEKRDIITLEEYKELELTIDKYALCKKLRDDKTSLIYTFQYPEILSCFEATSDARALATKKILAEVALSKGDETLMKDWSNNSLGLPYTSGITAIEADEMKTFRKNYVEGVVPIEGLVLTAGVDVQDNRFAVIVRAWGKNNNSWLVKWIEIIAKEGDSVTRQEQDANGEFLGIWGELTDLLIHGEFEHISGKKMQVHAISIDSGDNTELVYRWVAHHIQNQSRLFYLHATKGVKDIRYSDSEVYMEPPQIDLTTPQSVRKSLAERMGVTLYKLGAHRAHEEILRRIALNKNPDARSNLYYHNEQSYPNYEEQMTSCRKIIDTNSTTGKAIFKLIPGKRKEAMDAEKNALHAAYAVNIRNYSHNDWRLLENYYK
jgi:phage terminase large subunit GpA-like protein